MSACLPANQPTDLIPSYLKSSSHSENILKTFGLVEITSNFKVLEKELKPMRYYEQNSIMLEVPASHDPQNTYIYIAKGKRLNL